MKILLVEDNRDAREFLTAVLVRWGHAVWSAGSLDGAKSTVAAVDLVIADVRLPDGSGLELLAWLDRCGWAVPGIAMSGTVEEDDRAAAAAAGFAELLEKPVDVGRLRGLIEEIGGSG